MSPPCEPTKDPCGACKVAFIPFDTNAGRISRKTGSCCFRFTDPLREHSSREMFIMLDEANLDKVDLVEKTIRDHFYTHKIKKKAPVKVEEPKKQKRCESWGMSRGQPFKSPEPKWPEAKFSVRITPHLHKIRPKLNMKPCEHCCD